MTRPELPASEPTTEDSTDDPVRTLTRQLEELNTRLQLAVSMIKEDVNTNTTSDFDDATEELLETLREGNRTVPGPKHPAEKYYEYRRRNVPRDDQEGYRRSSNPIRRRRRKQEADRNRYQYQLAQFQFSHQRRKVARKVLGNGEGPQCSASTSEIEEHFRSIFETSNDLGLEEYPPADHLQDITISTEDVQAQIDGIKKDSACGPDKVLASTLKFLKPAKQVQTIIEGILASGYVPKALREGRMVLIPKDEKSTALKDFRPITIYSAVRRVIEKVLCSKLQEQVPCNRNQRGFVKGVAGCQVNTILVNGCIKKAKNERRKLAVGFLDMSKAFDNIGHRHLINTLKGKGVASNLLGAITGLLTHNTVKVQVGRRETEPIAIMRSVPQGGPMSPTLFNIATDFVLDRISDRFEETHGFQLEEGTPNICITAFADDTTVSARSTEACAEVMGEVKELYGRIGLSLNAAKSVAIVIDEEGHQVDKDIQLATGETIRGARVGEGVRYLGSTFRNEVVLEPELATKVKTGLENLASSQLLKPNQKMTVLKQYLAPSLNYQLQNTPLGSMPADKIKELNVAFRSATKKIVGLPDKTKNEVFYAPGSLRGLGLPNLDWEPALLQHNLAEKLEDYDDERLHSLYDCERVKQACRRHLGLTEGSSRTMRGQLRMKQFEGWAAGPYQGIGVKSFRENPKVNKILDKLEPMEWKAALKLNVSYANLRAVPGAPASSTTLNLCRRCGETRETIQHVVGGCSLNNPMVIARHNDAKRRLLEHIESKGYECHNEFTVRNEMTGQNQAVDILAVKDGVGFCIDPTIRYESDTVEDEVIRDKTEKYKELAASAKTRLNLTDCTVVPVWIGPRGGTGRTWRNLKAQFSIPDALENEILLGVLKTTLKMIRNHTSGR